MKHFMDVSVSRPCIRTTFKRDKCWGLKLFKVLVKKVLTIRQRMSAAQSRQKSYADNQRQPLEFEVGDRVFLKISPMRGVM
jgi:hypothetical protein